MVEKGDREIWVGESRFYLGEDDILYLTLVGEHDEKTAMAMGNALFKLLGMVEGKLNIFADNNKAAKASSEARKMFKDWSEDERLGKIAIFGMHPMARVIASFVMGVSRKKDMRLFKTKEEALAWLKE